MWYSLSSCGKMKDLSDDHLIDSLQGTVLVHLLVGLHRGDRRNAVVS